MGDGCVVELNRMFSTPCGTAWGRIGPHGTVGYPLYGTVWDCMGLYGTVWVWGRVRHPLPRIRCACAHVMNEWVYTAPIRI